ncbi:MAG: GNAT family N-acetyltransferase, partial [Desulfuromonadales bacterium]|nr:GNAT family N-acetyltransferase [Desulfuromonadales bacterium]
MASLEFLNEDNIERYESFLGRCPNAMLYSSINYRRFLQRILPAASSRYLLAVENGEVIGALPTFVVDGPHGKVMNSLPFYGSNGGVLLSRDVVSSEKVADLLLDGYDAMAVEEGIAVSTLITSPLMTREEDPSHRFSSCLVDERIGQLTPLANAESSDCSGDDLMGLFHQKTRNSVRKGLKSGFAFTHCDSLASMQRLAELHATNMRAIGGLAKPEGVFDAIRNVFDYDRDYRVYTATIDGEIVAALLVFFFNGIVEYFTPAVDENFRSQQPMSALIFHAMQDSVQRGARWWNWGG